MASTLPFKAVLTDSGAGMIATAIREGLPIKFTKMAVGNGLYTASEYATEALAVRHYLKNAKNEYSISSVKRAEDGQIKVSAVACNYDVRTETAVVDDGYFVNELAVYARIDGADIIYNEDIFAIVLLGDHGDQTSVYGNDYRVDYMPAYDGNITQISEEVYVTVGDAETTYVETTGAYYSAADGQDLEDNVDALSSSLSLLSDTVDGKLDAETSTTTVTVNSSLTNAAGALILRKVGNIVIASGSIAMNSGNLPMGTSSSPASGQLYAVIPSGYRPKTNTSMRGLLVSSSTLPAAANIVAMTNGIVYQSTSGTRSALFFSGAWETN